MKINYYNNNYHITYYDMQRQYNATVVEVQWVRHFYQIVTILFVSNPLSTLFRSNNVCVGVSKWLKLLILREKVDVCQQIDAFTVNVSLPCSRQLSQIL